MYIEIYIKFKKSSSVIKFKISFLIIPFFFYFAILTSFNLIYWKKISIFAF